MLLPARIQTPNLKSRLTLAGAGAAVFVALASPADAACSSPADVQDDSTVVYKCGDLGGAAATALHQLSNQTVITKTDETLPSPLPQVGDPDAKPVETATGKSDPPKLSMPEKQLTKSKPRAKAKPVTKRKKRAAARLDPSKTFHIKKPSLGQRIRKLFRFGSEPGDS